jgi:hypothetical protein
MPFEQQLHLAEVFLLAISILAVALASARHEQLKTALSLFGLLISGAWWYCNYDHVHEAWEAVAVLRTLPILVTIGWGISSLVHGLHWLCGAQKFS